MLEPQNKSANEPIVITCISDTHSGHPLVVAEPSDVLIHCGDCTKKTCTPEKFARFAYWMASLPFKHRILVGGNHDIFLEKNHDFVK